MRYHIRLHDELPRIGQGWRIVSVKAGRKWVHLETSDGTHVRITKDFWFRLSRYARALPDLEHKKKRVRKVKPPPLAIATMPFEA